MKEPIISFNFQGAFTFLNTLDKEEQETWDRMLKLLYERPLHPRLRFHSRKLMESLRGCGMTAPTAIIPKSTEDQLSIEWQNKNGFILCTAVICNRSLVVEELKRRLDRSK